MSEPSSRPPVCADDRWYPSSPVDLRSVVTETVEQAPALDLTGEVVGLIVPHAGYYFSAHVAGAGYRQVRDGDYDTVVLIGPDHAGTALGDLALPDFDAWRTPLGEVSVDSELVAALGERVDLRRVTGDSEHSLEVQLPFLQIVLTDFTLLPIMMGSQSPAACRDLGQAVADVVRGRQVLLVASTDLSHFQPDVAARQMDEETLRYVLSFDPDGLAQALAANEAHACGGGPVAAVMFAARQLGATQAHLVKYATSGDVSSDKSQVVGYAAVVLTKP